MIKRNANWGRCGPDQSLYLNGAYAAPQENNMNAVDAQAAKVAALRADLKGYRRSGDFFATRRGTAELAAAQATLDRLIAAAPRARAWSDRPQVAVRRVAP